MAVVDCQSGRLQGCASAHGVTAYLGVPFAGAPVGADRFGPATAPQPWAGVRAADRFAPACPQVVHPMTGSVVGHHEATSLALNVWTPQPSPGGRLPVLVWIHGGGFFVDSASSAAYDGSFLAARGAVVVTFNYRLGAFGFLSHPAIEARDGRVSGNAGIGDQLRALEWVRDNVDAFGGDPGNVTIFGQSAGATSVELLMATPQAAGLFHRAIAMSGGAPPRLRGRTEEAPGLAAAHTIGEAFAAALGASPAAALAVMEQAPVDAVMGAWQEALSAVSAGSGMAGDGVTNHLIVDGEIVTEPPPGVLARGDQHAVAFMAGTVAHEGTLFVRSARLFSAADRTRMLGTRLRWLGARAEELYPGGDDAQSRWSLTQAIGDLFVVGARRQLRHQSRVNPDVFGYVFRRPRDPAVIDPAAGGGTAHSSELAYVFGTPSPQHRFDAEDWALADDMASGWVRFAATGDPNGGRLDAWPRYRETTDELLAIGGERTAAVAGYRQAACDALDAALAR